jgi:hypothetical protein
MTTVSVERQEMKREVTRRNRREVRCAKHGFICDPEPGPQSQWLCPWCQCPWQKRRPTPKIRVDPNLDPVTDERPEQDSTPRPPSVREIVTELICGKNPVTDRAELFARLRGILVPGQIQNALEGLSRQGVAIPRSVFAPRRRADGLPDVGVDQQPESY